MKVSEEDRVTFGTLKSDASYGDNGVFRVISNGKKPAIFMCIVSDGQGWEHVSVSITSDKRLSTWDEMCFIKDTFWGEDETVIQFHPKGGEYVNNHPYVLHLWKKIGKEHELPPTELV